MKHLAHTFLVTTADGSVIKYEIYTKDFDLGYYKKIPEGTCRIISSKFDMASKEFKVEDINLNIDNLFVANRPAPNTWYSDGQHRVSLDMVINHLKNLN